MSAPLPLDFPRFHDGEAEPCRPGGLWSLWEMLEFDAAPFYRASLAMAYMKSALKERETQFKKENEDGSTEYVVASERPLIAFLERQAKILVSSLDILDAKVTLMVANRLLSHLKDEIATYSDLVDFIDDIESRLEDELSLTRILVIESDRQEYFRPSKSQYGAEFDEKFQSAIFEIDEAYKCYALSRPTAAVFHLMRTMEIGITAVARCLDIPDPIKPAERNWGKMLDRVKEGIDAKWPTSAGRMGGDGAFFESIYASLDAVRNPWRNATMHVENKYTDDEAEHILSAVKYFMKKLASRCDENGEPKA